MVKDGAQHLGNCSVPSSPLGACAGLIIVNETDRMLTDPTLIELLIRLDISKMPHAHACLSADQGGLQDQALVVTRRPQRIAWLLLHCILAAALCSNEAFIAGLTSS